MAIDKETKILVVDDMAYSRMSIKKSLTNLGFANANIETAADGVDALKKCTKFMPDIVILDLMLPKINDLNLIGLLLGINHKIKILVCSVITNTTIYKKALTKGAIDWIQKPVKEEILKTKIEALIKEKSNFTEKDMYSLKTEIPALRELKL